MHPANNQRETTLESIGRRCTTTSRRLHFAYDGGGIGWCERLLWTNELRPKRPAVKVFGASITTPRRPSIPATSVVWAEFNARFTARSALIVPLLAERRFRGVMPLGWSIRAK